MKTKMCPRSGDCTVITGYSYGFYFGNRPRPEVKRIRMQCPVCERRVWSSVSVCHDGCCVLHTLPTHKIKGWWKKAKKKSRDGKGRF